MTSTRSDEFEALRTAVSGEVHGPGDPGYEDARRVWNAQIDRRPAAVVMCTDAADVAAAIGFARDAGLAVTVRGGGHNTSGSAVADGALMLNLSRMNAVTVDVDARRARVGGGALLADLDAATQAHGLATPGGVVSHTGVGGLTLGGGMGWLTRMHGLSIDNLVGAEVVLADGQIVWTDFENRPDLFWALRGGGGNFGVVTVFEFRLFPVGPMVNLAMLFWEAERGTEALRAIREFLPTLPFECNVIIGALNAPPAPFVPEQHRFAPGIALLLVGFGTPDSHAEHVARMRAALAPLFEFVTPIPYTALQQMQDEGTAWGQYAYEKGTQVAELSDGVIEAVVGALPGRAAPTSMVLIYRLDAGYSAVEEDATAYGSGRSPRFALFLVGQTQGLDAWSADRDWVRGLWDALQPHALGIGDYINNMVEFDHDRIVASYGPEKYARLAGIKAVYDPDNVFRSNVNIPPAT